MKLLDTSFLVDYLKGREYTLKYLERNEEEAFFASSLSLFELFRGELKSEGKPDLEGLREEIGWLNSKKLDRETAEEAARIEKRLEAEGEKVNLADVLIAGTARNAGIEVVTKDSDFEKMPEVETERPES